MRGPRLIAFLIAFLMLIGLCLLFPRVLAFVEVASRELRYLWWLVLITAFGVWLIFSVKPKK
ncbi:MAG TPA: hypothetical protein VGM64_03825 [Lacunisphaera sp.]|jgi:hypothetical protein